MTITINLYKVLTGLLLLLGVFYTINVFTTWKLYSAVVDEPVTLSFTIILPPDGACPQCEKPQNLIKVINQSHNISYKTSEIQADSSIGKKFIDMYDITKLPAIIVSGDIGNEKIIGAWKVFSGRTQANRIIIENLLPFYDISSGLTKGVVDITLLTDKTCESCFDANLYLNMLKRAGIRFGDVNTYDVSTTEGKLLIKNYNLKKIPTVLISPEVSYYTRLTNSWQEVGTTEKDGWLVLREVQKLSAEFKSI